MSLTDLAPLSINITLRLNPTRLSPCVLSDFFDPSQACKFQGTQTSHAEAFSQEVRARSVIKLREV